MTDSVERKIGDVTVRIDRRTCIGSANCAKVEPDLFRVDDEGVAAFAAGADRATRDAIVEACRVCPVEALTAEDAAGNRIAP